MDKLKNKITRFMKDESGPTAVEYAVMLALIIGTAIGSVTIFGQSTSAMWNGNSTSIGSALNN
jgi:pilus assembly protein Flp/PilA